MRALLFLACMLSLQGLRAEAADGGRARIDYMLNCQGCHQPSGTGFDEVPPLRDHLGYFLQVPGGREFVVRVPGVATSGLDDHALADVLNWILREFSAAQLPASWEPYTEAEVARLRSDPLLAPHGERQRLVRLIEDMRKGR